MTDRKVVQTGNGWAMALLALAILAAAAVAFLYVSNEQKETNAVSGAAQAVGEAAQDVGDAVKPSN